MNENRVYEIIDSMEAFNKGKYLKRELLDEMMRLQRDLAILTFNDESMENRKMWEIEQYLKELNVQNGNIADEEFERYKKGSRHLVNLIKAEMSGRRGEYKAFNRLEYINVDHVILKNIELYDGINRSELDAIVITPNGLSIVEVKNTGKNIFIDENGDYYRTGDYLCWDSNIANKMDIKEELIRRALANNGIKEVGINRIVVFTNNRIEIQNKCQKIKTCFLTQLPYMFEKSVGSDPLSQDEMNRIKEGIISEECNESYPFEFDVDQFKKDFATLLAVLEEASSRTYEYEEEVLKEEKEEFVFESNRWNKLIGLKSKVSLLKKLALPAAAALVIGSIYARK